MDQTTQKTTETTITLPSKEEMTERLKAVDITDYISQKLFPRLLKEADREVYPEGVILLITLAIGDSCKGLPSIVETLTMQNMPGLLTALIKDEKGLAEALEIYNSVK